MPKKLKWDAGDLGCGELIMLLRKKINELEPGDLIEVIALDTGAIEDLPAWAKLTNNQLIEQCHPNYVFLKK